MTTENRKLGFVPVWRSLLCWEWHDDPNTLSVWIHLLLMASFHPSRWRGQDVEPGQVITSSDKLATKTGLSRQMVRTALKRLECTGEIITNSTNRFTVVTICNYEGYAGYQELTNQQATSKQPTSNQQATSNQPHSNKLTIKQLKKEGETQGVPRAKTFKQWTSEEFIADVEKACVENPAFLSSKVEFVSYWTEPGARRMKFQYQQTWETSRRLATWVSRDQKSFAKSVTQNHGEYAKEEDFR